VEQSAGFLVSVGPIWIESSGLACEAKVLEAQFVHSFLGISPGSIFF